MFLLIEGPSVSGEGTKDITVGPLGGDVCARSGLRRREHEDVVGLVESAETVRDDQRRACR